MVGPSWNNLGVATAEGRDADQTKLPVAHHACQPPSLPASLHLWVSASYYASQPTCLPASLCLWVSAGHYVCQLPCLPTSLGFCRLQETVI